MPGQRGTYGDLSRHPDATPIEGLVIVRIDAPLYFFNANVAQGQIDALVSGTTPPPRAILLDLAATADLDVTTGDMLAALVADLQERGLTVLLAQVKGPVRDRLRRTGLMSRIGEQNVYLSIPAGVEGFRASHPDADPAAPRT
jgi:MFS superfamily sulfate permease-like transporter